MWIRLNWSTWSSSMARLCCFSLHSWATWMRTGSGWLGFCDWRLDDSFLHWSACWRETASTNSEYFNCCTKISIRTTSTLWLRQYLVSIHCQEGFVELNGLKLLLHQLVFDTYSARQFHLFLWVKHILVLWKQEMLWAHSPFLSLSRTTQM